MCTIRERAKLRGSALFEVSPRGQSRVPPYLEGPHPEPVHYAVRVRCCSPEGETYLGPERTGSPRQPIEGPTTRLSALGAVL